MVKKIIIIAFILIFLLTGGCSSEQIVKQYFIKDSEIKDVPNILIEERKIADIEKIEEEIGGTYEIETGKLEEQNINDPFKPYYLVEIEEAENVIRLDAIYSEEGIEYAEIKFNEYVYKLKEEDIFAENYQVKAINENSVVLLKGDEIITLFLNQIYYD